MSPGNGCEEFMTDWSVVCADRKLTAQCWKDVSPQINKLYINISSWGPGMCYQWQNISWLHKHSFPPHPSKTSTQILGLYLFIYIYIMYIHIYTKFKVVYIEHQSKAHTHIHIHTQMLQEYKRCIHEMHTPKGMRCTLQKVLQNYVAGLIRYTPCAYHSFAIEKGIHNVYRHVYATHPYRCVCIYTYREKERDIQAPDCCLQL